MIQFWKKKMLPNKWHIIIFLLLGATLAGLIHILFSALRQTRVELFWTRLEVQKIANEVVGNAVRFSNSLVKFKVFERSAAQMSAMKSKGEELAKDLNEINTKTLTALEGITIDRERLENLFLMSNVPAAVRIWYAYSETEVARLDTLEGDHPDVVDYIRKYKLIPPAMILSNLPAEDTSRGVGPDLLHIFKNMSEGFFIECGAFDGYTLSNTFYLERLMNWTGVLIVAEPFNFEQVVERKRNAFSIGSCLSLSTKPDMSEFTLKNQVDSPNNAENTVQIHCFPLYSILLALNRTSVDFFSLEIGGNELDVLKTIPFDEVDIKVLLVEFSHITEGKQALDDFMVSKGYVMYGDGTAGGDWAAEDLIFIKYGIGLNERQGSKTWTQ